ncbi:amidoligase family protein [Histidinibacterium aquaticum]|uniref:Amidoligase enzyme n=1 Tax=Histidinibacterium aquaticum TaxID=2613962 RepID=A0A5J5GAW1_9RHOB|nr:amidoligase family protein [Histidinibacterium aquaticum]KAA9005249.1 hypothetical protein F3S47_18270 [Histidinibacterium aquaticum]
MPGQPKTERRRFADLPRPLAPSGRPRRTGVEIEFAGLTERQTAELLHQTFGGRIEETGAHELRLEETTLGKLKVYLDTAFRDRTGPLAERGLDLARSVVPIEIVTDPLPRETLPELDRMRELLREAGAQGSHGGIFFGFGLHLNPEIAGAGIGDILPVLTAYALLEDWLRYADPMDGSRRLLPFSDPYPRAFVDALAAAEGWSMDDLIDAYLHHTPTRNRGLDVLPVLARIDEARVSRALDGLGPVSPRPAWHYRLPDCRLGEPDWTIAYEWNRWVTVERLADRPTLLDRLKRRWREHRSALMTTRGGWLKETSRFVAEEGLQP